MRIEDDFLMARNRLSTSVINTAAHAMQAQFGELYTQGKLQREKALSTLRCWGLRSSRTRSDCSYGAMGKMAKTMGADMNHLQRPSSDPAMDGQDPLVEEVTIGSQALHPALRGMDDGISPYAFVICKNGNVGYYANDTFHDHFLSTEDACEELRDKKILSDYLWAAFISPVSLCEFYEALINLRFGIHGPCGEITLVVTVRDRSTGEEYPGLVRLRHADYPQEEYYSTMISIIPLCGSSLTSTIKRHSPCLMMDGQSTPSGGSTSTSGLSSTCSSPNSRPHYQHLIDVPPPTTIQNY